MNEPIITIFIPTYRRPHLLEKAVESAIKQTIRNISILICDNASGDNTHEVISKLAKSDPRINYICHETNIGMLANYEFGISQIKTKYFCILSDDDLLLPTFCEIALSFFNDYPNLGFVACSSLMVTKEKQIFRVPLDNWPHEGIFNPEASLLEMIGNYPVPITVLFRTEATLHANIDFDNIVAWDCDYLIQVASKFPIAISKKPCGIYVSHPDSFCGTLTFSASLSSIERLEKRFEELEHIKPSLKRLVKKKFREDYLKIASIHMNYFFFVVKQYKNTFLYCLKLLKKGYFDGHIILYLFTSSFFCLISLTRYLTPLIDKLLSKVLRKNKYVDRFNYSNYVIPADINLDHFYANTVKQNREYLPSEH